VNQPQIYADKRGSEQSIEGVYGSALGFYLRESAFVCGSILFPVDLSHPRYDSKPEDHHASYNEISINQDFL